MGHQNDDGNEPIRELLLSDNVPLICAVGLGESLKDTLPLTRRPKPRSIPIPARRRAPLRPIRVAGVADSGKACHVGSYKLRICHDLATLQVTPGPIPIRHAHFGMYCGFVDSFEIRPRGGLPFRGFLTYEHRGCPTDQAQRRAIDGDAFQCSLATRCDCFQYLPAHEWLDVNGTCVGGPVNRKGARVVDCPVNDHRGGRTKCVSFGRGNVGIRSAWRRLARSRLSNF